MSCSWKGFNDDDDDDPGFPVVALTAWPQLLLLTSQAEGWESGILSQALVVPCKESPSHLIRPVCRHLEPVDLDPECVGEGR